MTWTSTICKDMYIMVIGVKLCCFSKSRLCLLCIRRYIYVSTLAYVGQKFISTHCGIAFAPKFAKKTATTFVNTCQLLTKINIPEIVHAQSMVMFKSLVYLSTC